MNGPHEIASAGAAGPDMYAEGIAIVEAAAAQGLTLRMVGGLAVRAHCGVMPFCEREYSDLDMVGLTRQQPGVAKLLEARGYQEAFEVRMGSSGHQTQFYRPCLHEDGSSSRPLHPDDHIDIYLDRFRMDHEIDLRERLELQPYTIPVSDLLLVKLQTVRLERKDVRDIITILKDVGLGDDGDGRVDARYIAALCASDWGLYHDVTTNLEKTQEHLDEYELSADERRRIMAGLANLRAAIEGAPKTAGWRLRARIGERMRWYNEVEEQEGRRLVDDAGP